LNHKILNPYFSRLKKYLKMKFNEIISISAMPGLFKLVSNRGDGIIVTNIEDGKSTFVSTRLHQITSLENISIFRLHDETTMLKDVMMKMETEEKKIPIPQASDKPEVHAAYLKNILPDYDEERVHKSDMKKLVKWFHILKAKDCLPKADDDKVTENSASTSKEEKAAEEVVAEKPKKAPKKKKEA
jgi:hypothetical protein